MVHDHKTNNDGTVESLTNPEFTAQVEVLGMKYIAKDERKKTEIKDGTYTPHTRANTTLGTTADHSRLDDTKDNLVDKDDDYQDVEIKDPKLKKINDKINTARDAMADNIVQAMENTANLEVIFIS